MMEFKLSLKNKNVKKNITNFLRDNIGVDCLVHIMDDLKFYNPNDYDNYLSVLFLNDKVVIGPIKKEKTFMAGCLKCFVKNLESNKSKLLKTLDQDKEVVYYNEKLASEILSLNIDQYLLGKKKNIIVIDILSLEQKVYESSKNGGCKYCYTNKIKRLSKEKCEVTLSNLRSTSLSKVISRIENNRFIIDEDCGIIRSHYRDSASRALPLVGFESNSYNKRINSFGRIYDYKTSFYVGALEALERYSNAFPYRYSECYESEEALEKNELEFLPLEHFSYHDFSLKNITIPKLDKKKKINWVKVNSIKANKDVLIPEQIVYFDSQEYYRDIKSENCEGDRFVYESSNGGALGSCYEEAVIYGIFEYIERDSFLVYWYNKLPPTKLILDYSNMGIKEIQLYVGFLESIGYKLYCYDITLESKIPSIWVLIEYMGDDNSNIAFYTAAGSNINPEKALESALIECVTAIDTFQKNFEGETKQKRRKKLLNDFNEVIQLQDHLLLYSNKAMRPYLEFALNTDKVSKFTEQFTYYYKRQDLLEKKTLKEMLDNIVEKILKYHEDILVADTTNPNIIKAGLSNVKVIIPSMLTMTFGHQNRRVNIDRVKKAPVINKLRKHEIDISEINKVPHPFP